MECFIRFKLCFAPNQFSRQIASTHNWGGLRNKVVHPHRSTGLSSRVVPSIFVVPQSSLSSCIGLGALIQSSIPSVSRNSFYGKHCQTSRALSFSAPACAYCIICFFVMTYVLFSEKPLPINYNTTGCCVDHYVM